MAMTTFRVVGDGAGVEDDAINSCGRKQAKKSLGDKLTLNGVNEFHFVAGK